VAGPRPDGGYAIVTRDDGKILEFKTATCCHCQKIIVFGAPMQDEGGICYRCMKPVCGTCADSGKCEPFERKLLEEETKAIRRRSLERILGI
jgi:hypothetical protein